MQITRIVASAPPADICVVMPYWVMRSNGKSFVEADMMHEVLPLTCTSPSCGTTFRISYGTIEEMEEGPSTSGLGSASAAAPSASTSMLESIPNASKTPSGASTELQTPSTKLLLQKEEDREALDMQYFRRFHVILNALDHSLSGPLSFAPEVELQQLADSPLLPAPRSERHQNVQKLVSVIFIFIL